MKSNKLIVSMLSVAVCGLFAFSIGLQAQSSKTLTLKRGTPIADVAKFETQPHWMLVRDALSVKLQEKNRQGPDENARVNSVSPTVKAKLSESAAKLRAIQGVLTKVEKSRRLREEDLREIETAMNETGESLYAAFTEATRHAEEAAKSEGKRGNVGSLAEFEREAKADEASINQIEARLRQIQKGVENRSIKAEQPSAQRWNLIDREDTGESHHLRSFTNGIGNSFSGGLSNCSNSAAATAMPRLIAPCVSPCWNKQWSACLNCIISRLPSGVAAYNTFRSCWDGARSPGKVAKQALCLARFIAVLA